MTLTVVVESLAIIGPKINLHTVFDMVSFSMSNERERKEIQQIIENVLDHRDTDNTYFLSKLIEAALHKEGYGKK
jgi:hypothetical protein